MKKIITICALLLTAMLFTGCFLNPVAGKKYSAEILGFEHGYAFTKEGNVKEYSNLGTIGVGTYSYDIKTKRVTVTSNEGDTTEFLYDSEAKQLIETTSLISITYTEVSE